MRSFSIRELEKFSGIKAHTIRIWEKRYAVLKPQRSNGNFRHYTLEEVVLLLNIALLTKNGFAISRVAGMEANVLKQEIHSLTTEKAKQAKAINELIVGMFSGNIEEFETLLDSCVLSWGIGTTVQQVIIPFLQKVNLLSYSDSSSEAHFVVTAVRKKIILAIENASPAIIKQKTALLFLPKEQHYDLLLLYMAYLIKSSGFRVLYLGTNISEENLKTVLLTKKPDFIFTYITPRQSFKIHDLAYFLYEHLFQSKLFVTGSGTNLQQEESFPNVSFIHYNNVPAALEAAAQSSPSLSEETIRLQK